MKFPRSPEYILAQAIWENRVDAVVVFAFSPLRLLHSTLGSGSLTDTAEEKKAPLPGPVSSEEQLVLVQVGSFRMKENAEYLASDLQGLGFAACIVDFKLEDNLYYRVVVDPPRVVEEAQKVLMHLKDAGFEGFLLFPD